MPYQKPLSYPIRKIDNDFEITGRGDHPAWTDATSLFDFFYPWETATPPATVFKAVHGPEWVYFFFEVTDDNIHTETGGNDKEGVIDSSRVEIFFRRDEQLSPYYCLEIDAAARVLDYKGYFHRRFDYDWTWPAGGLQARADRHTGGYCVEISVSKASLKELGLADSQFSHLQAGLFRAECTHTVAARDHMRWISWMRPDAPAPDFHIPSAFGVLVPGQ